MDTKMMAHLYLMATITTSVNSQMIMKWWVGGRLVGLKIPEGIWSKIAMRFDMFVFSGCAATFVLGFCWMATMSKPEISYAYPFMSMGFVLFVLLSVFLFGESLNA